MTRKKKRPPSVEVRVYNVGLGDCILLTFRSPRPGRSNRFATRRLLIDFGSTGRNKGDNGNEGGPDLLDVAKQIVEDCKCDIDRDGKPIVQAKPTLDAVVVTHRHQDHMVGFGGKPGLYLTDNLSPKLIVRPWTEAPEADDAKLENASEIRAFNRNIQSLSMAQRVGVVSILKEIQERRGTELARETDAEALAYGIKNLPFLSAANDPEFTAYAESLADAVGVDDPTLLSNFDAMQKLQDWVAPKQHEYLCEGQMTALEKVIPQLEVDVLGPVSPKRWNSMKAGSRELWSRNAAYGVEFDADEGPYGVPPIFDSCYRHDVDVHDRKDNVRWLVRHLDTLRGHQLLSFIRLVDRHLNNTSLVLLLKFGDFRMLFPGDAESASWQQISNDDEGASINAIVKKLSQVDLYKVGHHGSDNATPTQSLWPHLTNNRDSNRPLHCVLSTQLSKYNTIPNKSLYDAMDASQNIRLMTTDSGVKHIDGRKLRFPRPQGQDDWREETKSLGRRKNVTMSYVQTFDISEDVSWT